MAFGQLSRINTNVQSLEAFRNLQGVNQELSMRQLRLSTGKRINRAEDDAAGYAIAAKLRSRTRGLSQALANIGDAKSMLTVGEGSLDTVMEILQRMRQKATQAANGSLSDSERGDIQNEMDELKSEFQEVINDTEFNGVSLFSQTGASTITFQVGQAKADQLAITLESINYTTLASVDVSGLASANNAIATLKRSINTISDRIADIGSKQKRLSFKQQNVQTAITNYESARSQIEDADFAKEQMEIAKMRILQQTGTSALTQANSAPQSVLQLFQG